MVFGSCRFILLGLMRNNKHLSYGWKLDMFAFYYIVFINNLFKNYIIMPQSGFGLQRPFLFLLFNCVFEQK